MIYIDENFFENFIKNKLGDEWPQQPEESTSSWENSIDPEDFEAEIDEADEAIALDFANRYAKKVLPLTIEFYPEFRKKGTKLKELLLQDGIDNYWIIYNIQESYLEDIPKLQHNNPDFGDITIHDITTFIHNSALDCLLENYDAWFKKKISFENIYVESFCIGTYVKRIHNLLKSMLHEFFPDMTYLPAQQLDGAYNELICVAWAAYFAVLELDPDELNDSTILHNLEDYEFEKLLRWPGPTIERDENGKIKDITVYRNEPNPNTVPKRCILCKSYYNPYGINILCRVNRFDQRNSPDFKCRAYEKI